MDGRGATSCTLQIQKRLLPIAKKAGSVLSELVQTTNIFRLLHRIVVDLASTHQESGCPYCGGRLHYSTYKRQPRGGPEDIPCCLVGSISSTEISHANVELSAAVERWRMRDLSQEQVKYIFMDGVNFHMRINRKIELVPVLAAIGVTEAGHRQVLSLQSGDKELSSTWREFFKDLKARGLNAQNITLGIMDGLPGLEKVFREEFPGAKVQRCQVHVARNVLAKVPRKSKKLVADDMRSIFYASSRKKAMEFFELTSPLYFFL